MYRLACTTGLVLGGTLLLAVPQVAPAQNFSRGLPRAQPNRPVPNNAQPAPAFGVANVGNAGPNLGGANATLNNLFNAITNGDILGAPVGQPFAPGGVPFNGGGFNPFPSSGLTPYGNIPQAYAYGLPYGNVAPGYGYGGYGPSYFGNGYGFAPYGTALPVMNGGIPIGNFQPVFAGNPYLNPYLNPNLFNPLTNPLANPFFAAILNPSPGPAGTTGVSGVTNPFQALYGPLAPGTGIFP